jgi:hypothetical protein
MNYMFSHSGWQQYQDNPAGKTAGYFKNPLNPSQI